MSENAYKKAGVDTEAGIEVVERIKPMIEKTKRSGVMDGLGGFGALFDLKACGYKDPVLVSATDGVGTKLRLAIDCNIHDSVGIDLVAMCVNDLIVQGAEPLFFLDYFATAKVSPEHTADVIAGIAKGCEIAGCALIGGETAEMPGMYGAGDYDLAGFTVGAAERAKLIDGRANIKEGDVIIGLASSGIHSNGYSLVRHILKENNIKSLDQPAPFDPDQTLADVLLCPTRIYVKSVLNVLGVFEEDQPVHGMVHITGGGFEENVPRAIPEGLCAQINLSSWDIPGVFKWLQGKGNLSQADMTQTFNCGIGMVMIVDPQYADQIMQRLEHENETCFRMGSVISSVQGKKVDLLNTLPF